MIRPGQEDCDVLIANYHAPEEVGLDRCKIILELFGVKKVKLQKDIFLALKLPNRKRKLNWQELKTVKVMEPFTITNNLKLRRNLLKNTKHLQTIPFGFQCNNDE